MAENRCPLIENCQQKSAVCNVMLPDETCYWFRWFRALDNPWHTGTPTEEGWYLIQTKRVDVDTGRYIFKVGNLSDVLWFQSEGYKELSCYGIVAWQKIEPYKENEDGRID